MHMRRVEIEVAADVGRGACPRRRSAPPRMRAPAGDVVEVRSRPVGDRHAGPASTRSRADGARPSPTIGDVAYAVMRRNLSAMLAHEAGTRLGEDPEELHDMRVATRRLRAALDLFAEFLPVRAGPGATGLGWVADHLGAVRDLDVQLERVARVDGRALRGRPRGTGGVGGHSRARARPRRARSLLDALESTRYERLVTSFATLLRQGPSRRVPASRSPAVTVVPDLIRGQAPCRRQSGQARPPQWRWPTTSTASGSDASAFATPWSSFRRSTRARPAPFVKRVVRLQDNLGLMQDARVAVARLHDIATGPDIPPLPHHDLRHGWPGRTPPPRGRQHLPSTPRRRSRAWAATGWRKLAAVARPAPGRIRRRQWLVAPLGLSPCGRRGPGHLGGPITVALRCHPVDPLPLPARSWLPGPTRWPTRWPTRSTPRQAVVGARHRGHGYCPTGRFLLAFTSL